MHFTYRKLMVLVSVLFLILITVMLMLFNNRYYLPPLPFDNLSKKEVYQTARDNSGLTYLTTNRGHNWYIMRGNALDGSNELIAQLKQQGYTFKEQMGAAYMFASSDESETLIVSSQMWTGKFVLFQLPEEIRLKKANVGESEE